MQEQNDRIKSSWEIALERSSNLQIDSEELRKSELEKIARQLAAKFLNKEINDFSQELNGTAKKDIAVIIDKLQDVLLKNLQLPRDSSGVQSSSRQLEALTLLKENQGRVNRLRTETEHFFKSYLEQYEELLARILEEAGPAMERLERQLEAQTGMRVKVRPENNPEFVKRKNQIVDQFNAQANEQLETIKSQFLSLKNKEFKNS